VENRNFDRVRQKAVAKLDLSSVDSPITDIIERFTALPHCFTLQCCFGHFIREPEQGLHNTDPIPTGFAGSVTYRIAYIAFCLENSPRGRAFRQSLARLSSIDPGFVQFGSADWFWERCVNSYVLQVEPEAHMLQDEAILSPAEALRTQEVRNRFFRELRVLLAAELAKHEVG